MEIDKKKVFQDVRKRISFNEPLDEGEFEKYMMDEYINKLDGKNVNEIAVELILMQFVYEED